MEVPGSPTWFLVAVVDEDTARAPLCIPEYVLCSIIVVLLSPALYRAKQSPGLKARTQTQGTRTAVGTHQSAHSGRVPTPNNPAAIGYIRTGTKQAYYGLRKPSTPYGLYAGRIYE